MNKESIWNSCSIEDLENLNKEYGLEFPINNGIHEFEPVQKPNPKQ